MSKKTDEMAQKIGADEVTLNTRDKFYIARKSFFYKHGKTQNDLARAVKAAYPDAQIISSGEKYILFRGGDTIKQGSHWWVNFRLA